MSLPLHQVDESAAGAPCTAQACQSAKPCRCVRSQAGTTARRILYARHEGQAIVLVAFAFILLIGALGLGIDAANGFGQRRLANNVADAAAMAATRELVNQRAEASPSGTEINDIIEAYFAGETGIEAPVVNWQAFYVDRENLEGSMGAVTSAAPPSGADGIRVQVNFAMPTIFMAVFGQESLTIGARGTAVFGPLGTAVGQDLAPLALSPTGLERLKEEGIVRIDLRGDITDDPPLEYVDPSDPDLGFLPGTVPDDVIETSNFAHVSLSDVSGTMGTGNFADCTSTTPVNSLIYWWCRGTPHMLQLGRELPAATDSWGALRNGITWRESNRNLLVLPVYADSTRMVGGTLEPYRQLVNFVAVEIRGFGNETITDATGLKTYADILEVEWVQDYATSGAMVGEGSALELTEVWAVNLVR